MSHTPEPWKVYLDHRKGMPSEGDYEINQKTLLGMKRLANVFGGQFQDDGSTGEANAARIVACVNGCAGLNPAAYRECVKALEKALQFVGKDFGEMGYAITNESGQVWQALDQALAHAEQQP